MYNLLIFVCVREIDQIDLVNGVFQTKILRIFEWNDGNLAFMDLNDEDYLDKKSSAMIWKPWIIFSNILRQENLNLKKDNILSCIFYQYNFFLYIFSRDHYVLTDKPVTVKVLSNLTEYTRLNKGNIIKSIYF